MFILWCLNVKSTPVIDSISWFFKVLSFWFMTVLTPCFMSLVGFCFLMCHLRQLCSCDIPINLCKYSFSWHHTWQNRLLYLVSKLLSSLLLNFVYTLKGKPANCATVAANVPDQFPADKHIVNPPTIWMHL